MDDQALARQFELHRTHLRAVAYRILGSLNEADDAVQESWLRLIRSDHASLENLRAWLTTVVARVCLDMLRARREEPGGLRVPDPILNDIDELDPEQQLLLAGSVGLALQVVLETLGPAERIAFVLHDVFAIPFDEIAPIVGRSEAAARQLASRARRRVQGTATVPETDRSRQREVVGAFLAASRGGDFDALLAVLDPDVVVRADHAAAQVGAPKEIRGAAAVAANFKGRARAAQPALIDGLAGAVWAPGGQPRVVLSFTITDGKIVAIDLLADPTRLGELDLEILGD